MAPWGRVVAAFVLVAPTSLAAPGGAAAPVTQDEGASQPLVVVLPPLPPPAEISDADKQTASAEYTAASHDFRQRRYDDALTHAEAAFAVLPNASTALIRATILDALVRHREAFEAYLLAYDLDPTENELALIIDGIESHGMALDPPLGYWTIGSIPADAEKAIGDARWVGTRTVGLSAGVHFMVTRAEGRVTAREPLPVEAGRGQHRVVALRVAPDDVQPPDPDPDPVEPPVDDPVEAGTPSGELVGWTLVGVGAASVIAGAVVHGLAFGAESDANALAAPDPGVADATRLRRYTAAKADAQDQQIIAFALYGVAALAAGVGVALIVTSDEGPAGEGDANVVSPVVLPGGAGAVWQGRF